MASFDKFLETTTKIHHASSAKLDIGDIQNKPTWFALEYETASTYGEYMYSFKSKRRLKLLDVANLNFHNDFVSKVNSKYEGRYAFEKTLVLLPLGLPNYETQTKLVVESANGLYPEHQNAYTKDQLDALKLIQYHLPFVGNKHRFSFQQPDGGNPDKNMVEMMIELYPTYDGYISDIMWPSYHHGGFFKPEVCIFKPLDALEIAEVLSGGNSKVKKSRKPKMGGSSSGFKKLTLLDPRSLAVCNPLIFEDLTNHLGTNHL